MPSESVPPPAPYPSIHQSPMATPVGTCRVVSSGSHAVLLTAHTVHPRPTVFLLYHLLCSSVEETDDSVCFNCRSSRETTAHARGRPLTSMLPSLLTHAARGLVPLTLQLTDELLVV